MEANIPRYLTRIIGDFLSERPFVVSLNNQISTPKTISTGLPQGSVLSPILYSIYISDFRPPSYMESAYYADDTVFITSGKLTKSLLKKWKKVLIAVTNTFISGRLKLIRIKHK